jgi:hypothetical protein
MARFVVLPSLIVALVIGAYLVAANAKSNGPTAPAVTQQIGEAQTSVAATNFQGADTAMQAWYAQNGTYAGATLPPGSGVVLVRADAVSYCLQAGAEHEVGPGSQLLPGGC